ERDILRGGASSGQADLRARLEVLHGLEGKAARGRQGAGADTALALRVIDLARSLEQNLADRDTKRPAGDHADQAGLVLAFAYPDRIARLVLNTAGGSQADPEVMARIRTLSMAAVEAPTWETVAARIKWLMADKSKDYDDIVASRQAIYRQPGFLGAMSDIMALQDPVIRARNIIGPEVYGSIGAPTLVLWTSDDPTADVTEGRRIASMIPGARFEVMPDCGHWPQYEDPANFNRIHLDFLLGR
ncbi:MAG TPA: alpha/beta hydrolase, partial [Mycolicibacterium fallax]|nr:alpha/beta hydrolase [Mycolicibacterium fallax]